MTKTYESELLATYVRRSEHGPLVDLWLATSHDHSGERYSVTPNFAKRRDLFFWALDQLLRQERIRLQKMGVFLDGPIEEQLDLLRQAFPYSEDDADQRCTKPGFEAPYPGFGMNVWWFLDICPVGVAWRQADGSYLIAD